MESSTAVCLCLFSCFFFAFLWSGLFGTTCGTIILITLIAKRVGSTVGAVVRALAFHQCGLGSIPGLGVISGPSLLIVLSAPRGFSPGTPLFPSPKNQHLIWFVIRDLIIRFVICNLNNYCDVQMKIIILISAQHKCINIIIIIKELFQWIGWVKLFPQLDFVV